ncbi:hypothetical protein [Peribacillus butanolivorans]|uniref:hypothetical protein n=1 Tax=Peribacillus butanolivorans TaxID=421767 RepID=UPI0036641038
MKEVERFQAALKTSITELEVIREKGNIWVGSDKKNTWLKKKSFPLRGATLYRETAFLLSCVVPLSETPMTLFRVDISIVHHWKLKIPLSFPLY